MNKTQQLSRADRPEPREENRMGGSYQFDKSNRGLEWCRFTQEVLEHIETYTIPQYGDAPNDEVESWTPQDCIRAISKYCKRFGKNQREGGDLLDMLKIAHFACLAHGKLQGEVLCRLKEV